MRDQIQGWEDYSAECACHIAGTRKDKYAPEDSDLAEPMDLYEDHFGLPWLCGQVSKYAARIPKEPLSKALVDILKIGHYASRIYFVLVRSYVKKNRRHPMENSQI